MNVKKIALIMIIPGLMIASCGDDNNKKKTADDTNTTTAPPADEKPADAPVSDKGIGKFTDVKLNHPLNQKMVKDGEKVYDVKCASCHKLSDEKLVGPGWKGVTDRRKPEWIMNFVTNVDEMIDKDPEAQAMLEECMVRMPNQNLSDDEARNVLEFMLKNDGKN